MLINKTSATTSKVVISAQRNYSGGSKRNNRGYKYSSLRGGASSLSN